jgi:putative phosphoribosyl transferase
LNNKAYMFQNRVEAGRKLAAELQKEFKNEPVVVLAIPNGGVPVAFEIACTLSKADLSLIISRKIPVPLNPEAGLGAIADDGTIFLDEETMKRFGLNRRQIEPEVNRVRAELKKRHIMYYKDKPLASVVNKTVIIVDDGIAAGLTMRAAVESVRHRHPGKVIAAVPVAARSALNHVANVADQVITCIVGEEPRFFIADFYRRWYDVNDDEVMRYLEKWQARKMHRT